MRVVEMSDIIYVLELHLETSEAAGIVLDNESTYKSRIWSRLVDVERPKNGFR